MVFLDDNPFERNMVRQNVPGVVVPELPELAAALPALRATASNSIAKALHASSHRGLCTLHRSISSCDPVTASRLFFDAARQCAQLENSAKKRMFDI